MRELAVAGRGADAAAAAAAAALCCGRLASRNAGPESTGWLNRGGITLASGGGGGKVVVGGCGVVGGGGGVCQSCQALAAAA